MPNRGPGILPYIWFKDTERVLSRGVVGSGFCIKMITIFLVRLLWLCREGLGKRETDLLKKAITVFSVRTDLGLY